ncbi:MAG: hypothetical protein KKH12_05405 [Gammaproteobacteria bacterium]|nr:hypothetical protein [Gammaproteobacteria bacterium]MBU1481096.1 hypothetical protein [Gammaproteobacteria bacterium]
MAAKKESETEANKLADIAGGKVGRVAKVTLMASANAAAVVSEYADVFGEQDMAALSHLLRENIGQVVGGDLGQCEAMLLGQAHALQSIFVNLARRASIQQQLPQYEAFMRLALKAQYQCRGTLETLSKIKNPPVLFAKQANINQGNGNQQVNNGSSPALSRTGKNVNQQNELLEVQYGGASVDSGTTGDAIGEHPPMEALGGVNRRADAGG